MDNVKVHYKSSLPAQINALACAQGTDIYIAPGQEQHLPHEAWHVVQQRQGRVRATTAQVNGVGLNDDAALEAEADRMGARAILGECGGRRELTASQFLARGETSAQADSTLGVVIQRTSDRQPTPDRTLKDAQKAYKKSNNDQAKEFEGNFGEKPPEEIPETIELKGEIGGVNEIWTTEIQGQKYWVKKASTMSLKSWVGMSRMHKAGVQMPTTFVLSANEVEYVFMADVPNLQYGLENIIDKNFALLKEIARQLAVVHVVDIAIGNTDRLPWQAHASKPGPQNVFFSKDAIVGLDTESVFKKSEGDKKLQSSASLVADEIDKLNEDHRKYAGEMTKKISAQHQGIFFNQKFENDFKEGFISGLEDAADLVKKNKIDTRHYPNKYLKLTSEQKGCIDDVIKDFKETKNKKKCQTQLAQYLDAWGPRAEKMISDYAEPLLQKEGWYEV